MAIKDNSKLAGWFQHSALCPKCNNSYYSFDGVCNIPDCGNPRENDDIVLRTKNNISVGRIWNKKTHKYQPISAGGLKKY